MYGTNTNFSTNFSELDSVFVSEKVFSSRFVPSHLLHRENEMESLVNYFKSILTDPISSNKKVIIYGPVGTGKTVVSRAFGTDLVTHFRENHKKGDPLFQFLYVNTRPYKHLKESWKGNKIEISHLILTTVLRQLVPGFPLRGFSVDELLRSFTLHLKADNLVSLLVLDEIDSLLPEEQIEVLYSLSRIEEDDFKPSQKHYTNEFERSQESRFNLLCCVQDKNFLHSLDTSTVSSLGRNIITFPPYSKEQLFDIVNSHAEIGLRRDAYSDELIDVIADFSEEYGDARFAIELLWRSAKIADQNKKKIITIEHSRKAILSILPIERSILYELDTHRKLLLLSIARLLKDKKSVTTLDLNSSYFQTCDDAGICPRPQSHTWTYVKDLERLGLISIEIVNIQGKDKPLRRIATIKIRDIPAYKIITSLDHLGGTKKLKN